MLGVEGPQRVPAAGHLQPQVEVQGSEPGPGKRNPEGPPVITAPITGEATTCAGQAVARILGVADLRPVASQAGQRTQNDLAELDRMVSFVHKSRITHSRAPEGASSAGAGSSRGRYSPDRSSTVPQTALEP